MKDFEIKKKTDNNQRGGWRELMGKNREGSSGNMYKAHMGKAKGGRMEGGRRDGRGRGKFWEGQWKQLFSNISKK